MSEFSLKLDSKTVEIENTEGVTETYTINELEGDSLESYLNSQRENMIMEKGEVVGMKSYKGIYTSLLVHTLVGPDDKTVALTVLKTWPSRVQKGLFEIAQKLNGLDVKSAEEAKND